MNIIDDLSVNVEKEEVVLILGGNLENSEKSMKIINDNMEVFNEGLKLVNPRAIYDIVEIDRLEGNRLYLDSKDYFESKLIPYLMPDIKYLALCVVTVGKDLEEKAEEYMSQNQYVKGLVMDGVGTIALEKAGLKVRELIKGEAAKLGLGFSASLSPGQVGWHVSDQRKIFTRLKAEKIGVALNKSSLMIPKKSISLVMGIGEGVRHDKKACDFCNLRNSCPSRKVYDYQGQKNN